MSKVIARDVGILLRAVRKFCFGGVKIINYRKVLPSTLKYKARAISFF